MTQFKNDLTELARVELKLVKPNDTLVSWSKLAYALMSDGTVRRKTDIFFKLEGAGLSSVDHGPVVGARRRAPTVMGLAKYIEDFVQEYEAQGFSRA